MRACSALILPQPPLQQRGNIMCLCAMTVPQYLYAVNKVNKESYFCDCREENVYMTAVGE